MQFYCILIQQNHIFIFLYFFHSHISNEIMILLCFNQNDILEILLRDTHVSCANNKSGSANSNSLSVFVVDEELGVGPGPVPEAQLHTHGRH